MRSGTVSVVAFPTFSECSVTDTALSTDILDTFAAASGFAGYDMATPLNPVNGGAAYPVGPLFPASAGNFEFTKSGGGVPAVPEPSSVFLIVLGLSGLAAHRTGRRTRTRS